MHSSHRQSAERVVCIFTILASFVLVVIASVLAIRLEDRPELESRFCDSFEPSLRLAWLPLEAYAVSVFCCCMTREGWLTKNAVSAGASIPSFLILSRCSSVTSLAIRFPTVCWIEGEVFQIIWNTSKLGGRVWRILIIRIAAVTGALTLFYYSAIIFSLLHELLLIWCDSGQCGTNRISKSVERNEQQQHWRTPRAVGSTSQPPSWTLGLTFDKLGQCCRI